jgi:hypothetical protein
MQKTGECAMSKLNRYWRIRIMRNIVLYRLILLGILWQASLAQADTLLTSPQDVSLELQPVTSLVSGRDAMLRDVTTSGKLIAGRDLECQGCKVSGPIIVGRNLELRQCEALNAITSGRNAELSNTRVESNVTIGHDLMLNNAVINGETQVGNQVIAKDSSIQGPLFLQGNYLKLDHSAADTITFKKPEASLPNHHQNMTGSTLLHSNGHTMVRVGSNNLSSVNGYTIKGASDATTVITPDSTIYVNARKVSGTGPKTYSAYQAAHPEAPHVQGPGWSGNQETNSEIHSSHSAAQMPVNTLELINRSKISAAVVFESGYGKILVHPGCEFTGKVTNGRVERLPD